MDLQIVVSMLLVLTVVNLIVSWLCLRAVRRLRGENVKCKPVPKAAPSQRGHGGQITLTGGAGGATRS